MSDGLIPPPYLVSAARQAVNRSLLGELIGREARKSHMVYRDLTAQEQQPQMDWVARYEAIMEEGRTHGWIEWDGENGYVPAEIQTRAGTRVFDETEEDHAARVAESIGVLRFETRN